MDWPKQVRRGVTATLFMTTAAWVQSASAEAWPAPDEQARSSSYNAYMTTVPEPATHKARVQIEPVRPVWNYAEARFFNASPPMELPQQAAVKIMPIVSAPALSVSPSVNSVMGGVNSTIRPRANSAQLAAFSRQASPVEYFHIANGQANAALQANDLARLMPASGSAVDASALPPPPVEVPVAATVAPAMPNPPALQVAAATPPAAPVVMQASGPKNFVQNALRNAQEAQNQKSAEENAAVPAATAIAPVPQVGAPAPLVTANAPAPVPPMQLENTQAAPAILPAPALMAASPALPAPALVAPQSASPAPSAVEAPVPPPVEMTPTAAVPTPQAVPASSQANGSSVASPEPLSSSKDTGLALPAVPEAPSIADGGATPDIVPKKPVKKKSQGIPVTAKAPVTTSEAVLRDQAKRLSNQVRAAEAHAPITLSHEAPGDARLKSDDGVRSHTGVGVSISVRNPSLDANYELNQAYQSLGMGDSSAAITTYKRVLEAQPRNTDALFGLATTYHRSGRLPEAKQLYTTLLAIAPEHRDGLNNFLMLLGEENPAEAIQRLRELEAANPNYAPVPAQIAMICQRQDDLQGAVDAMTRAVARDPDNLAYRYNLAVLLDQAGNWNDAAGIYQDVLVAVDRGGKVPGTRDSIQQRLTYLMTRHSS